MLIPLGILSSSGKSGWLSMLGTTGSLLGQSIVIDSTGNLYIAGFNLGSPLGVQLAKYNNAGEIQWQRRLGSAVDDRGYGIAIDSSDNIFVVGYATVSSFSDLLIAKYNSSGTIQWQRRLGASGVNDVGYDIKVGSTGDVYVVGTSFNPGTFDCIIAKYNTSGTIQWQRRLGGAGDELAFGIALDSLDNIYLTGRTTTQNEAIIAKYNSLGTIQWQRRLGDGSLTDQGSKIAVDNSGNIYVAGYTNQPGSNNALIFKYDSSGNLQWQRRLGAGATGQNLSLAITIDSSDYIYITGRSDASGVQDILIAKYDTSGTIQWQRRLGSSLSSEGLSITSDTNNKIYVSGFSNILGSTQMFLAKLPSNGSLVGSYSFGTATYTYAASSLTDASISLTAGTTTFTDASTSLTDASTSLTDAATTLVSTTRKIP